MTLPEKLRKLAEALKRAARQSRPKPIGNPVASRATGDLGSIGESTEATPAEKPKPPSLPKTFGG